VVALLLAAFVAPSLSHKRQKAEMQQDPACQSLTPVSAGGPAPKDPETVVVRWLGWTNYELAYRGDVFLLDTYYDRGRGCIRSAWRRPTSGRRTRSSSATRTSITSRTRDRREADRRPVIGASFRRRGPDEKAACPPAVQGGQGDEIMQYPGVTVEAALGHHNVIATTVPAGFLEKQSRRLKQHRFSSR